MVIKLRNLTLMKKNYLLLFFTIFSYAASAQTVRFKSSPWGILNFDEPPLAYGKKSESPTSYVWSSPYLYVIGKWNRDEDGMVVGKSKLMRFHISNKTAEVLLDSLPFEPKDGALFWMQQQILHYLPSHGDQLFRFEANQFNAVPIYTGPQERYAAPHFVMNDSLYLWDKPRDQPGKWWKLGSASQGAYFINDAFTADTIPCTRQQTVTWVDTVQGKFYMFGGLGLPSSTYQSIVPLSDLWSYSFVDKRWELVQGSNYVFEYLTTRFDLMIGRKVVGSLTRLWEHPGSRFSSLAWQKPGKFLYLWGGQRNPWQADDLIWRFNLNTKRWSMIIPSKAPNIEDLRYIVPENSTVHWVLGRNGMEDTPFQLFYEFKP